MDEPASRPHPAWALGTGERFTLTHCNCKPVDAQKALSLAKGQTITVWGIGGDEIVGSLDLDHCDW